MNKYILEINELLTTYKQTIEEKSFELKKYKEGAEIIKTKGIFTSLISILEFVEQYKNKSKNFAHFSFQLAIVCVILSVMVGALSSVSKALSSDDRGILASNVDFVAELQDNTNVYDEELQSLGRDISKVSNQFSELQDDLSTLSEQISSQLTDEGNPLNNDEFLDKISTLIEEKSLTNNSTVVSVDDTEEVKELKKNLDIATELLRQVTLANVNLQKRDDDVTETLNADSLIYYIGDLKEDMSDLRNFSLQLLANTALADSRSELNTFKEETKKSDKLLSIPIHGKVDSLNLSVATAIILYEALNQRKFS